jgi:hypothetical protein
MEKVKQIYESSVAWAGCNGTSALNGTETNSDLWNRQIFNSPETFLHNLFRKCIKSRKCYVW